jgi:putative FmdB family regulatory protein
MRLRRQRQSLLLSFNRSGKPEAFRKGGGKAAITVTQLWTLRFGHSYNPAMPIYEYECQKCHSRIEVFQKASDKPPKKCSKCGGKLERMVSAPAIQFKGTGWYVTDYASKATKSEKTESEPATEKKTEKKAKESSPAKKASDKTSSTK